MSDKNKDAEAVPAKGTFDLGAYLAGKSTFPTFSHTVYLDQAAGMELVWTADEYDRLADRGREITKLQGALSEQSGIGLVDSTLEDLTEELDGIVQKTDALAVKIKNLEKELEASGHTLSFRIGTPQKLAKTIRRSETLYKKKYRNNDDVDLPTYQLAAQLAEHCTSFTSADGTELPVPDTEGFLTLLDSLIGAESMRLITEFNKNVDSSQAWAARIDAGFPGRDTDVGGEPVGDSSSQGGAVVGHPADDADRGEEDAVV